MAVRWQWQSAEEEPTRRQSTGHEAREFLEPILYQDDLRLPLADVERGLDKRGRAELECPPMDYHAADGPEFDQGDVNDKLHRADDRSGQARRAGL